MESTTIESPSEGILVQSRSHLSGSGNQVLNSSYATLSFWALSTADFHQNDLLKGDGPLVRTEAYSQGPTFDIDLTNNYWGTVEADSISAWIQDGNDPHGVLDPNFSNVLFEPFLPRSVPVRKSSFGGVKTRFRNRG